MICPYMTQKITTEKDGVIVTKETFMECAGDGCPFYSWKNWNKAGQGCTKAYNEIEAERRRI